MKRIVIDPGHGGPDTGAVAVDGQYEKQFTLSLSLAVRERLQADWDCTVFLTRETDQAVASGSGADGELRARADVANRAGADLLVSLHHDSAGDAAARGGSLYIWTDKRSPEGGLIWLPADGNHTAPRSYAAAQVVYPIVRDTLADFGIPWRGEIMCADFGVLRYTSGPCMLIECFFGSNPTDVAAARRPEFVGSLAQGIASGIAAALQLPARSTAPPTWDPVAEIEKLRDQGLIVGQHAPGDPVTWGEFATVVNRLLER